MHTSHLVRPLWAVALVAATVVSVGCGRDPVILEITQIEDTTDPVGPYVVLASILDDHGIDTVGLRYLDGESPRLERFIRLEMEEILPGVYRAEIPGFPVGSLVNYFVAARDVDGNVAREPAGPVGDTYIQFRVIGAPVNCISDAECGVGSICDRSTDVCRTRPAICETLLDCPRDRACDADGDCVLPVRSCELDTDCRIAEICDALADVCVPRPTCSADGDCTDGRVCDASRGECVRGCSGAADCDPIETCVDDQCGLVPGVCAMDMDCPPERSCIGGLCMLGAGGCSEDSCEPGFECILGTCLPATSTCSFNGDCPAATPVCDPVDGVCVAVPVSCAAAMDCPGALTCHPLDAACVQCDFIGAGCGPNGSCTLDGACAACGPVTPCSDGLCIGGNCMPTCPTDLFEPNDLATFPATIAPAFYEALVACSDDDWYLLPVGTTGAVVKLVLWAPEAFRPTLELYRADNGILLGTGDVQPTGSLAVSATLNADIDVLIRVYHPAANVRGVYDLDVRIEAPGISLGGGGLCDACASPADCRPIGVCEGAASSYCTAACASSPCPVGYTCGVDAQCRPTSGVCPLF